MTWTGRDRLSRGWVRLIWLLAAGCASTSGARPDDMSAAEHREAAASHEQERAAHAQQYDPEARPVASSVPPISAYHGPAGASSSIGTFSPREYNPTEEHQRNAEKHAKHAADHAAAADALEAFEAEECGRFPPRTRRSCPLLGKVIGVEDIDAQAQGSKKRGIRIRFVEGISRDAVIAHMRCHIAFGRTQGRKGMDHCPLYVEGVDVGASTGSEANTVDLLVEDGALVDELRRRARAHMPGSK